MKVAIVHDYLNQLGGAERVVAVLHGIFPDAPIFTTIMDPHRLWPELHGADIRVSWMQGLPGLRQHFKKFLMFYPHAIESIDLSPYDVVISSSSAFAKSVITRPDALHLCYCHTPMRFAWDYDRYVEREQFGALTRAILPLAVSRLRNWDRRTAGRPTLYLANSTVVSDRIKQFYGRDSEIIFPPVDVSRFNPMDEDRDFYLVVSRLNPYKRIDLVVDTFNELNLPLVIVGEGPDRPRLEAMAGNSITFTGRISDEEMARYYATCRAFIFPGEEDFGIAPLEANASGRPVIAFRAGGALDTVIDGKTGVYFDEQTVPALREAIIRSTTVNWDKASLRRHASKFSEDVFRAKIMEAIKVGLKRLTDTERTHSL